MSLWQRSLQGTRKKAAGRRVKACKRGSAWGTWTGFAGNSLGRIDAYMHSRIYLSHKDLSACIGVNPRMDRVLRRALCGRREESRPE